MGLSEIARIIAENCLETEHPAALFSSTAKVCGT